MDFRRLERTIERMQTAETPAGWTYLTSPLTAVAWTNAAYSTTAKTLIDLSTVFGVPVGVKAVAVRLEARDNGSAAATAFNCWVGLSPNNTSGSLAQCLWLAGVPNDFIRESDAVIPCDANGDIYYQINATGAGTMDVWIEIWGYTFGGGGSSGGLASFYNSSKINTVTGTYTVTSADQIVRANGTFTVNLPSATGSGALYILKNCGAGTITVDAAGAETIEGAATFTLYTGDGITVLDATAGNWEII